MTSVEPKIAERRQRVTEERARRRMGWLVLVIAAIVLGAGGYWLIMSPVLSIRGIEAIGAVRSAPIAAAESAGVVIGIPTISVDEGAIIRALEPDPWIEEASVEVSWPGSVVISVSEHVPVATVTDGTNAAAIAVGGQVLEFIDEPNGAVIEIASVPLPGSVLGTPALVGAVEFVSALEPSVAASAVVVADEAGLRASVSGFDVRLGRPVRMGEKAAALTALLELGVAPGVAIDVTAPTHPAVFEAAQPSTSG